MANSHSEGRKIGIHSSVFICTRYTRSKSGLPDMAGTLMPNATRAFDTWIEVKK